MPIRVQRPDVSADRWREGCDRSILEALTAGKTHARITGAVAFAWPCVRTISRREGNVGQITLPDLAMKTLGVRIGDQIVLEPTEQGTLELRPIREGDLPELARSALERANKLLPPAPAAGEVKSYEKSCEACAVTFFGRRPHRRFCPSCSTARAAASKRASAQRLKNERRSAGQVAALTATTHVQSVPTPAAGRAEPDSQGR